MSWIVQTLLKNRTRIKAESDFESDEFNDLLLVEQKIKELYLDGRISDYELNLINFMSSDKSFGDAEKSLNVNRISISKHFQSLCEKIALYLGGYFTDAGYLELMRKKHGLNDEQVKELQAYMQGRYKNKIIRRNKHAKKPIQKTAQMYS